jgi:BMFP domain-containing protein YqiC
VKHIQRGGFLAAFCTALVFAAPTASAASQDPVGYLAVGAEGARIVNFPDKKGLVVWEATPDVPLALFGQPGGSEYVKVGVPGGVRVWIFGRYLEPAPRDGWLVLNENRVQMRPVPSSGSHSYPVGKLSKGAHVRMIGRADEALAWEEDWIQVWSPPGTRAWVAVSQTRALPAGTDGAAAWRAAVTAARDLGAPSPAGESAPSGAASGDDPAVAAMAEAEALMARFETEDPPQVVEVRAAYQAVLALEPDAPTRHLVQSQLAQLDLREQFLVARAELERERDRREALRASLEEELRTANRRKDPLLGRFQARGWVERFDVPEGEPTYRLRWSGRLGPEVVCTSGRYDLDQFVGYEIGTTGFDLQPLVAEGRRRSRIDVGRIEVLSGRGPVR